MLCREFEILPFFPPDRDTRVQDGDVVGRRSLERKDSLGEIVVGKIVGKGMSVNGWMRNLSQALQVKQSYMPFLSHIGLL